MLFGGVDAHRSYLTVAIVDENGELVHEESRVPIEDGEPLLASLDGYRPLEVVVEACSFWPWIADTLEPTEIGFHLAHARKLEAIAQAETKTDSVDARLLARMLGAGLIPEVYPKPPDQREIVRLVRHRDALVEERTRLANRVHSHLHQQGLELGTGRLLTEPGRQWLREEAWPWLSLEQRTLAKGHLELIDQLIRQIEQLDERIEKQAGEHPTACLLQTIPGFGSYRSLKLTGEVAPISRFLSPDHLVSYGGLAPTTRQSGAGDPRHGQIPKGANHAVRDVLHSAAGDHVRAAPDSAVSRFYRRKAEELGKHTARTAAARKLCRVIYAMLSTGEVWRE